MPAINSVKIYVENGYYHIYNRGIDKREIFIDHKDYMVLLSLLKRYLVPWENSKVRPRYRIDLHEKIQLISYCLMPNHFHLMMKQFTKDAITEFMRALTNSYVLYFNSRYERIGPLFQGRYKAVLIEKESYFLHLTRYIHTNPLDLGFTRSDLAKYRYSSYGEFIGERKTEWIHFGEILDYFKSKQKMSEQDILSYQSFVEDSIGDSKEILETLSID
ncbi:MAG: transposase [Candidatus Levybacteria bacterium]|nr:transposase [Candidatus Levybacteria bacterium]